MAPKRKAPQTPETASARRSTRISSSAKKSRYFEDESADEQSEEEYTTSKTSTKSKTKTKAVAKSTPNKRKKVESDDESDDVYNDEEEASPEDVADEEEESFDESAPPKITYIPLPKLRDTGGVPYEDSRLHKNTMLFLKDLKANNQRTWLKCNSPFRLSPFPFPIPIPFPLPLPHPLYPPTSLTPVYPAHDPEFRRALKDFESYITALYPLLISSDPTIPELPLKDIIFRIYRDTRFSKDPTPYKPHFSAAWSRTGRKGPYAVYYLHVQPGGGSFVGGGLYYPPAEPLSRVRASIDERPWRWRRVLNDPEFRRTFLEGAKPGEEGAVSEFVRRNREGALKTRPKVSDNLVRGWYTGGCVESGR